MMFKGLVRNLPKYKLVVLFAGLLVCFVLVAQPLAFRRVSTAQGLSDNLVHDAVKDHNGLLWIATAAGLNSYDGYRVKEWHHLTDRHLQSRDIVDLWCDPWNKIWMLSRNDRLLMLDSMRRPHDIHYARAADSGNIRFIFPQPSTGHLYLLVDRKLMVVRKGNSQIEKVADLPDSLLSLNYAQESPAGKDHFLIAGNNRVVLISLAKGKVIKSWHVPRALCAFFLTNGHLLVSTENNRQLFVMDTASGKVLHNLGELHDQFGKPVNGYLRYMAPLPDGRFAITSGYGGMYVCHPLERKLWNYAHDPLDDHSVSGNNTFRIRATPDGFIFVTTRSSGLNIVNIKQHQARSIVRLSDNESHRIFDGFVSAMAQHADGQIWLGSQGGLFQWNGVDGRVSFREYGTIDGEPIAGKEEVRALYADEKGQLWVGLNRFGVVVLNRSGQAIRYFNSQQPDSANRLPSNFIMTMVKVPADGLLWIAAGGGLRFADLNTMRLVRHPHQSLLDTLGRMNVSQVWVKNQDEVWVATNRGAWQYLVQEQKLKHYGAADGLHNTVINSVCGDPKGNVYFAGRMGIDVLKPDGSIHHINRSNGLPADVCQSLVTDKSGRVWAGNTNYLFAIDPQSGTRRSFDASYGFIGGGFRLQSAYALKDGRLLFGCNEGISVFDPDALWRSVQPVQVRIEGMEAGDSSWHFTGNAQVQLNATQQSPVFQLQVVALHGLQTITVQYRLLESDTTWKSAVSGLRVAYNTLRPGKYTLELRYHTGDQQWLPGSNKVSFSVARAWYWSPWFIALLSSAIVTLVWITARMWLAQRKLRREEAETEMVILQLTQTLHQQQDEQDMLWQLAQNCISRLQLEDCVIYLLDKDRKVLGQQAAWGPKMGSRNSIEAPIEIPVGKGIVGHAAATGEPVLVNDTRLDPRYIVDDQARLSELAVPIIAEGLVIGVIDSEHSRKAFFTSKHLAIFNTIASVLGSKIMSIRSAAEKHEAEMALVENRQRMSEVEMKALRAQMNPHFMFNSLNSINNFILKSDTDNASAYLTRFARLMRLILDNSRHEWISLENELHALRLYIDMESIRFDNAFSYDIILDPHVDPLGVLIPPMIIQPYVENAIWHGLLHRKQPGSQLLVNITRSGECLRIVVEDNGVGRKAAMAMKSKFGTHKQSHGMQITEERLQIVNDVYQIGARASVEDICHSDGSVAGTRVILTMKYNVHESSNYR